MAWKGDNCWLKNRHEFSVTFLKRFLFDAVVDGVLRVGDADGYDN